MKWYLMKLLLKNLFLYWIYAESDVRQFLISEVLLGILKKMSQKMIFNLVVIILVFNVYTSLGKYIFSSKNSIIFGHRVPGDHFIMRTKLIAPNNRIWFRTHEETYSLASDLYHITQIIARDLKPKAPYGKCKILKGGPGWKYVTLRCKSLINKPVNFIIEMYGI